MNKAKLTDKVGVYNIRKLEIDLTTNYAESLMEWKNAPQPVCYGRFGLKFMSKKVNIDNEYQLELDFEKVKITGKIVVVEKKGIFRKTYTFVLDGKLEEIAK
jgi:hypothetical protein